jgi:hypothetical protein
VKIYSLLVIPLLLQGCASLNRETVIEESTYWVADTIDAAQTIDGAAKHPKLFAESDEFHINGYHPGAAQIIEYQASNALVHLGVTYLLARGEPGPARKWLLRAWEAGTIGIEAKAIANNYGVFDGHMFYQGESK